MKAALCYLSIALFFFSCKKGPFSNFTNDEYSYAFFSSSKIDTMTNAGRLFYQITPGSNIVFKYTHAGPDCKNIADEKYTEYLVFQVPATTNSFEYRDSNLADALTIFNRVCFCPPNAGIAINGLIKGTKLSATKWRIEINIFIPGTRQSLVVNKDFTLQ